MSTILLSLIGCTIAVISCGNLVVWLKIKSEKKDKTVLEKRYNTDYFKQNIYILNNRLPKKAYYYIFEQNVKFPQYMIDNFELELSRYRTLDTENIIKKIHITRKFKPFYFNWISDTGLLINTTKDEWFMYYPYKEPFLISVSGTRQETGENLWKKSIDSISFKKKIPLSIFRQKIVTHDFWVLFWFCHEYKYIDLDEKDRELYKSEWNIFVKNL